MATGTRIDPYRSFNFIVEIDGIARAGFQDCSGLDTAQDPVEYREGNHPITVRKLTSLVKYSNITLKWGVTDDSELWDWRKIIMSGKDERKNGSIVLLDATGAEKKRWNFREGWPTKWTGPTFNAKASEVAIETLEIAHEGLELA
jgi:phage tail-like protein